MSIKIVHVISSLTRGGKERQLATIAANTDYINYPSLFIYFNEYDNSYIGEYNLSGYTVKVKSKQNIARLWELHRILKKHNPDIVFTWGIIESVLILLINPFHRFKFINGSVRHGIRSFRFSHYFRSIVLHLSKNILANSKAGLRANNIKRGYVLYNGIHEKFIGKYNHDRKTEMRKRLLGYQTDRIILVSVANLVPYKDYFSILMALKKLKEEGFSFCYLILGDGPLRSKIVDEITEYNLIGDVNLLGRVDNVEEYLKISDIFIHSSKGEGCSNAILEAMAAGLPVIASDTGGTTELVTDKNGFLYKLKNYTQLCEYVKYCIENRNVCTELGDNAVKLIKERFTVKTMMNNYYTIINTVINRKKGTL